MIENDNKSILDKSSDDKSETDKSSDNKNESDRSNKNKEKRTRNRLNKREKYKEEREELIKELEKRMGLTEEIRGVLLYDLEKNEELKEYLLDNMENIKKIYKCGGWNYFIKKEEREEIGLLKSIFKDEKYELISKRQFKEIEEKKKQYTYLYFMINVSLNDHLKINKK